MACTYSSCFRKEYNFRNDLIMAKIQELYDRASGETIYPVSTTRAVICPNGSDLETRLTSEKQSIESRREKAKFALFVDLWNEAWGEY